MNGRTEKERAEAEATKAAGALSHAASTKQRSENARQRAAQDILNAKTNQAATEDTNHQADGLWAETLKADDDARRLYEQATEAWEKAQAAADEGNEQKAREARINTEFLTNEMTSATHRTEHAAERARDLLKEVVQRADEAERTAINEREQREKEDTAREREAAIREAIGRAAIAAQNARRDANRAKVDASYWKSRADLSLRAFLETAHPDRTTPNQTLEEAARTTERLREIAQSATAGAAEAEEAAQAAEDAAIRAARSATDTTYQIDALEEATEGQNEAEAQAEIAQEAQEKNDPEANEEGI